MFVWELPCEDGRDAGGTVAELGAEGRLDVEEVVQEGIVLDEFPPERVDEHEQAEALGLGVGYVVFSGHQEQVFLSRGWRGQEQMRNKRSDRG